MTALLRKVDVGLIMSIKPLLLASGKLVLPKKSIYYNLTGRTSRIFW